jgi:hypothetical protein
MGEARAWMLVAGMVLPGVSMAQTAPPVAPPAPPVSPATESAPGPTKEPTLDELLGIVTPAPKEPAPVPPATDAVTPAGASVPDVVPGRTDLDRKLSDEAEGDDFSKAVLLMGDAARRLKDSKDPGLATQRLQEDALKSLDKLISDAQKSQQQKSKQKQQQQQQQQQQQSPSSASQKKPGPPQPMPQPGPGEGGEPQRPREDGPGRTRAGNTASWGDLPARVREALVEGLNDRFSARYRQKTEEYYKRLAEDKNRDGVNR